MCGICYLKTHQIFAEDFGLFARKVSALPKRKLRGVTPVDVRTKPAVSRERFAFSGCLAKFKV